MVSVAGAGNPMVNVFVRGPEAARAMKGAGIGIGEARLSGRGAWDGVAGGLRPVLVEPGGTTLTTLMTLAPVLDDVSFGGGAADDRDGRTLARAVAGRGVTWHPPAPSVATSTARCLVLVGADGERSMLTDLGAAGGLQGKGLPTPSTRPSAVVTEVYQWDGARPRPVFDWFESTSADHRLLTLSDVRAVQEHRARVVDLAGRSALMLVGTRAEVGALLQLSADDPSLDLCAGRFLSDLPGGAIGRSVVITDGPRPAVWCDGHERIEVPAEPCPQVVDVTGAGDLFCAGLLLGLLAGRPPSEQLRWGHLLAAAVIGRLGTLHVDARAVLGL